jgi:opacity protein-like surface antigen
MPDDRRGLKVVSAKKGQAMRLRLLLCGVVLIGISTHAGAADLGDSFLRGSSTTMNAPGAARWDGFYFGAQVGATYSGADFTGATRSLVGNILRESTLYEFGVADWNVLSKADTSGSSIGGFFGYNAQWDDAVVGLELNYNRTSLAMASTASIGRQPAGFPEIVYIDGNASMRFTDYGTARVRGGWTVGSVLPYGFVGVALGRADVSRSATVNLVNLSRGPGPFFTQAQTDSKLGDFAYGYTAGLGIDICLVSNLFVRAEYEYVQFGAFNEIKAHIHTARVGAGVKF